MGKSKVHTLSHLDAAQGAGEKRSESYFNTVKRAPQSGNTVMRQKQPQSKYLWFLAGGCGG